MSATCETSRYLTTHTCLPVLMTLGCASRYVGRVRPKNMENPRTKRFLEEFRSTSCRLDRPTAVIIPEPQQNTCIKMTWSTHLCQETLPDAHRTTCRTFLPGLDPEEMQTGLWTFLQNLRGTWYQLRIAPPACFPPAHRVNKSNTLLDPTASHLETGWTTGTLAWTRLYKCSVLIW